MPARLVDAGRCVPTNASALAPIRRRAGAAMGSGDRMAEHPHREATERRAVRSEDPSLSPDANRLLTDELRQAVGRDEVEVPAGTPRRTAERRGRHSPVVATLATHRQIAVVSLLAALVIGAIVAFATGAWWAVVVALGLHALGTMLTATAAVQLTTEVEHVAPETAARLEEEGVADPDRMLTDLVEDFAGAERARGAPEVVSSANNERTVHAGDDPARATVEQRTAMTPQSEPGPAAGERSAVEALPWWVVIAVMVLSAAAAPFADRGWALPLIVVPIGLGWIALQWFMARSAKAESRRPTGDTRGAQRRLAPVIAFVVAGVVWFSIVGGLLMR
jgi:hypothetical protein